MRELKFYECEKCNERYEAKEKAVQCEHRHIKPTEVVNHYYSEKSEYPEQVEVLMEDGWTKTYYK